MIKSDSTLDQAYANLTKFNSLGFEVYTKNAVAEMDNPIPGSVRQIAHEMIKTLKDNVMDLFVKKETILRKFEEYERHCSLIRG